MGLTPAELDKALEQGKVSLQDFQGFAKAIFDRYGKNAEAIAKSPKAAGDQLQVQLQRLQESVGRLLQPIGAFFQKIFGSIVNDITRATNALARFLNLSFDAGKLAAAETRFETAQAVLDNPAATTRERQRALRSREEARKVINRQIRLRDGGVVDVQQPDVNLGGLPGIQDLGGGADGGGRTPADTSQNMVDLQGRLGEALQDQNAELVAQTQYLIRNEAIAIKFEEGRITALKRAELLEKSRNQLIKDGIRLRKQAKNGAIDFNNTLTKTEQLTKNIATAFRDNMAQGISDVILKARSLQDVLGNVLKMAANMLIQFGVKSMFSAIPGFDKIVDSANGNVFYKNNVVPFARGGIVNKPTLFPMANGAGLMGEAGPEAIMPLRRGPSGRLGVEAAGGGAGNVVVNVDAGGSAVQGDSPSANQLGKAIGAAVQAELIKQKRPGGLLST